MARPPVDLKASWQQAIGNYDAGDFAAARKLLTNLRKITPNHPQLLHLLGVCEARMGDEQAGIALLERAIILAPQLTPALSDLGNLLSEAGRVEDAIAMYQRAIGTDGRYHPAVVNLAHLLASDGRQNAALAAIDAALTLAPEAHQLRWIRSLICLSYKDFIAGWQDYRVRWQLPSALFDSPRYDFGLPAPQSADLYPPAEPVWVWREQGIGDEIFYASAIPEAMRRGWKLRFGCSVRLLTLFRRSFPGLALSPVESATAAACADCRSQMPLADLAAAIFPNGPGPDYSASFLAPDPALCHRLRERYQQAAAGRRLIGLSWRSSNRFSAKEKSLPLQALTPLLRSPDWAFINLQYGDTDADLAQLRRQGTAPLIEDPEINPLGDQDAFAAQVAAMDAVVSVSNSTVHLAGGLGVPTVVLLPKHTGLLWYWFRSGTRSPWYSSLTLTRQTAPNDWAPVITAATEQLRRILNPADA